jgi:hypothetical protein
MEEVFKLDTKKIHEVKIGHEDRKRVKLESRSVGDAKKKSDRMCQEVK